MLTRFIHLEAFTHWSFDKIDILTTLYLRDRRDSQVDIQLFNDIYTRLS